MKKFLVLTIIFSFFAADIAMAWEEPCPAFCRAYRKKKPFALKHPNLAVCLNAAQGYDDVVGTIEWCRKSYTRMGVDNCGRTIQWRATDITYREVLCNGAYGKCFTRTQRDGPIQYVTAVQHTVPASAKGGKVSIFK